MKNLQVLYDECIAEVEAAGIKPGNIIEVKATNMKKTYGKTIKNDSTNSTSKTPTYIIRIAKDMLKDESPTKEVKATIIHEICHTVEGCFNHNSPWLSKIEIMNKKYGYKIKEKSDPAERGLGNIFNYKYEYICRGCGQRVGFNRMCDFVRHPENYKCGKCGNKFERM